MILPTPSPDNEERLAAMVFINSSYVALLSGCVIPSKLLALSVVQLTHQQKWGNHAAVLGF